MNIKNWYLKTYNDDLGQKIKDKCDFDNMDHYDVRNIYNYLGVDDSVIRDRVFRKLANLLGVDYKDVYYVWLKIV